MSLEALRRYLSACADIYRLRERPYVYGLALHRWLRLDAGRGEFQKMRNLGIVVLGAAPAGHVIERPVESRELENSIGGVMRPADGIERSCRRITLRLVRATGYSLCAENPSPFWNGSAHRRPLGAFGCNRLGRNQ